MPVGSCGTIPVVRGLLLLVVVVAAVVDAQTCEKPCLCFQGGLCNGTLHHEYKGQTFGSCYDCPSGWSGARCDVYDFSCTGRCWNAGTCTATGCVCRGPWAGASCTEPVCPVWAADGSRAGTAAAPATRPPDDLNRCAPCDAAHNRFQCLGCSSDAGCPASQRCNTSFAVTAAKTTTCRLAEQGFANLMGGNGIATIACEDAGRWAAPGQGRCRIDFVREQPACAKRPLLLDNFFSCEAQQCTQTVGPKKAVRHGDTTAFGCGDGAAAEATGAPGGTAAPPSGGPDFVASDSRGHTRGTVAVTALLGVCLAAVVLLSVEWSQVLRAARMRRRLAAAKLATLALLLVLLAVLLCVGARVDTTPEVQTEQVEVATISCATMQCTCGKQATGAGEAPSPQCSTSPAFLAVLSTLRSFDFECVGDWEQCTLTIHGLALPPFHLAQCAASECVAEGDYADAGAPPPSADDGGRNLLWADLAAVAAAALGAAACAAVQLCAEKRAAEAWVAAHAGEDAAAGAAAEETEMKAVQTGSNGGDPDATAQPPAGSAAGLFAANLSYEVPGARILSGFDLAVPPCRTVAVMGPSGSGKTSLMDLLAHRTMQGRPTGVLYERGGKGAYLAGLRYYKDDVLHSVLTVRQQLDYCARLSLPVGITATERHRRILALAAVLELERVLEHRIGDGLSTGERRRVSVALAVLSQPRLLLLDEPTSGLDAHTARLLVAALCGGMTGEVQTEEDAGPEAAAARAFFDTAPVALFSIHQPSAAIFAELDLLLVLSGGRVVYYGPAADARTRLCEARPDAADAAAYENPADYVADVAAAVQSRTDVGPVLAPLGRPAGAAGRRRRLVPPRAADGDAAAPRLTRKLATLLERGAVTMVNDHSLLAAHAGVTLVFAALLSVLYAGQEYDLTGVINRSGVMTFLLLLIALSSMSVIDPIVIERGLFKEDKANRIYGTVPYFSTKLLLDFIFVRIVPTVCLAATSYFAIGLRTEQTGPSSNPFLEFVGICVLFNLVLTAMCVVVAGFAPSTGAATLVCTLVILFFFLFNGPILQLDSVSEGARWLRWVSPFAMAFEVLMVNELAGLECTFAPTDAAGRESGDTIKILCEQYLINFDLQVDRVNTDIGALVLWLLGYLALGCVVMHFVQSSVRWTTHTAPRGTAGSATFRNPLPTLGAGAAQSSLGRRSRGSSLVSEAEEELLPHTACT